MELIDAIRTRKSIRSFKPDPISKDTIKEILEIATRAPSAVNRQPWEFFILTGEILDKIKKAHIKKLRSPTDHQGHSRKKIDTGGIHRRRQVDLAIELFKLMNITREDTEKRAEWNERGFRFFDAPVAIILVKDISISHKLSGYIDVGSVSQTICLTALEYGLGTCIESQGMKYPEVLREYANIPESKEIVTTIAIGYPNWDFPANSIKTPRESLGNNTTWCGFE